MTDANLEAAWLRRIEAGCGESDAIKIDALLARVEALRSSRQSVTVFTWPNDDLAATEA